MSMSALLTTMDSAARSHCLEGVLRFRNERRSSTRRRFQRIAVCVNYALQRLGG